MSEMILHQIYKQIGVLTEEETYQLLMRVWDELSEGEDQQQAFRESTEAGTV